MDSDDEDQRADFTNSTDSSQKIYMKACTLFKVTPSTFVYRHLTAITVPLQNHAIGDRGAKAMATALVVSPALCFFLIRLTLSLTKKLGKMYTLYCIR